MNSGIVDMTWTWSPRPTSRMCSIMPSNSESKTRGRLSAPSAAAPSMIVNSGAPLTKARVSRATGIDTKYATAAMKAASTSQPTGVRLGSAMSVPRSRALGRQLAAHEVVDVDGELDGRVQDDERPGDRHRRHDGLVGDDGVGRTAD